jgi:hypothetical protein
MDEFPTGFPGGFFGIFIAVLLLIFVLIFGAIAFAIVRGLMQWNRNNPEIAIFGHTSRGCVRPLLDGREACKDVGSGPAPGA